MKIRHYLMALATFALPTAAQEKSPATTEVSYLVSCINDTVEGKVLTDTFRLRFNDSKALFYRVDDFISDSTKLNDADAWARDVNKTLTRKKRNDKTGMCYYILTDLQGKTYVYKDRIGTNAFRYTDSLPNFNWKILPEQKTIAGHKCAKAVGKYMGRTYEAWYATDIPERLGPWKFNGLPGLVMAVYDTRRQYTFTFIDMQACNGDVALFPSRAFKTTKEKFLKEYATYQSDPIAYYATRSLTRISFGTPDSQLVQEIKNNNRHHPMEILE